MDDHTITPADVLKAFDKGEEARVVASSDVRFMLRRSAIQRLYMWSLKCRGYDESFQKKIWDLVSAKAGKE